MRKTDEHALHLKPVKPADALDYVLGDVDDDADADADAEIVAVAVALADADADSDADAVFLVFMILKRRIMDLLLRMRMI